MDRAECYETMEQLREILGDETIINEINCYFSADIVSGFLESIMTDWNIEL